MVLLLTVDGGRGEDHFHSMSFMSFELHLDISCNLSNGISGRGWDKNLLYLQLPWIVGVCDRETTSSLDIGDLTDSWDRVGAPMVCRVELNSLTKIGDIVLLGRCSGTP